MSNGRDILYDPILRDISFMGDDLGTMSDLQNLKTQLHLRLLCEKGELRGYPEYGTNLYRIIDKALTPTRIEEIQREVTETLMQDSRVRRVDSVQVVNENGTVTVSAVAYDQSDRLVSVSISEVV